MLLKPLLLATISIALLNGCGGGGGGDGGSGSGSGGAGAQASGVTVSTFSSGASLSNLKLMNFYGSDLYVMGTSQTNQTKNGVLKFNSTGAYQSTIGTINDPLGIAFYSNGKTLVSGIKPGFGSALFELDISNGSLTDKISTGNVYYGIAVNTANANSEIYLTIPLNSEVLVYNAGYGYRETIVVPNGPMGLVYSSQTTPYIYVTQNDGGANGVRRINVNNTASFDQFNSALFDKAAGIAIRTNTTPHEIYVVNTGTTEAASSVVKVSLDGSSVSQVLTAANPDHKLCSPVGIAISGSVLYVANTTCTNAPNSSYANVILKVQL